MKRRLTPILTISFAIILVGSIAYAADRRKHAKHADKPADRIHEEEALRAELLDAVEAHDRTSHDAAETGEVVGKRFNEKTGQIKSKK